MDSRRSPDRDRAPTKRPKELSFYKRDADRGPSDRDRDRTSSGRPHASSTTAATGSFSTRRDPLDRIPAGKRRASSPPPSGLSRGDRDRYAGDRDSRDTRRDRDWDRERDRSPDRQRRRMDRDRDVAQMTASDDERELERRRREYKGGAPLQRVETRVEDRRGADGKIAYLGGEELRRVPTRDERPARPPVPAPTPTAAPSYAAMIEVIANDRLGRKVRVKCSPTDTVGDLKKLIAAQVGTNASKIQLKKWYTVFKDHIELRDYEIHDGMSLEMY